VLEIVGERKEATGIDQVEKAFIVWVCAAEEWQLTGRGDI